MTTVNVDISTSGLDPVAPDVTLDTSAIQPHTFASPAGLIQTLSKWVDDSVTINVGAGTFDGFTLSGFMGSGTLTFVGSWSAVTPTTGDGSGAAGAGTSATSLVKPTGASNWTASDLRGKFVRITSGTASGTVRPILANDTTTLTIHSASGLAAGDRFEIVTHATTCGDIVVKNCRCSVVFKNVAPDSITSSYNSAISAVGCLFDDSASDGAFDSDLDDYVLVDSSKLASNASIVVDSSKKIAITNSFFHDGSATINGVAWAITEIEAYACDQTALKLQQVVRAQVGLNAKACTYTPLHFVSVHHAEPYGTGIAGSSNTGSYGIIIEQSSWLDTVGYTTLSGSTSDLEIQGNSVTYAGINANGGVYWAQGCGVQAAAGTGVYSPNWFTILQDLTLGGSGLFYGLFRFVSETLAAAGTGLGDSTALAAVITYCTSGSGGGFHLWPTPYIGGQIQILINNSGGAVTVYPGDAAHYLLKSGATSPSAGAGYSVADGEAWLFVSVSGSVWWGVLL